MLSAVYTAILILIVKSIMSQAPHTIYKEGISLFTSVASNQRSYPESGQMVIVVARETK